MGFLEKARMALDANRAIERGRNIAAYKQSAFIGGQVLVRGDSTEYHEIRVAAGIVEVKRKDSGEVVYKGQ